MIAIIVCRNITINSLSVQEKYYEYAPTIGFIICALSLCVIGISTAEIRIRDRTK